jgi:hypothetical protein
MKRPDQAVWCTRPDPPARREERTALVSRTRRTTQLTEDDVTKLEAEELAKLRELIARLVAMLAAGRVL